MRKTLILIFSTFFSLVSCNGQTDNSKTYNKKFIVASIDSLKNFVTLNSLDKSVDSIYSNYNKSIDIFATNDTIQPIVEKTNFVKNRSRILLIESQNGFEKIKDKIKIPFDGFSSTCECVLFKDTLFISSGIGLFGGVGLSLKIYGTQFEASYFEYTDDVKPYKLTEKSEFTDNINVLSKYQYLQLDKEPDYKAGQQLSGYLTLTSNNYFSDNYRDKLDTNFVKARMKFTCITKRNKEKS